MSSHQSKVKEIKEIDKIKEGWEECKEFLMFVEEGNLEGVKEALKKNPELVKSTDGNRKTALHIAATLGHKEILYYLIAAGSDLEASNVNSEGLDHFRALHFAAKEGWDDVVRALVEAGAEVDPGDRSKLTPLHRAIESGHEDTASLLLDLGADPLKMDCNQMDAISWAAKVGLTSILMDMVERTKGQRELNARDKRGMTPLGHAIKSHKWDAAKFLLAVGADPDLPDLCGRTPRYWAALNGKNHTLAGLTA